MRGNRLSGISTRFRELSQTSGQVAYVLLTRPPLTLPRRIRSARLACIRHAASVRPEPGSNSPLKGSSSCTHDLLLVLLFAYARDFPRRYFTPAENSDSCSVFKEQACLACPNRSVTTGI